MSKEDKKELLEEEGRMGGRRKGDKRVGHDSRTEEGEREGGRKTRKREREGGRKVWTRRG